MNTNKHGTLQFGFRVVSKRAALIMRHSLFVGIFLNAFQTSMAQKKALGYTTIDNWPIVHSIAISNDGSFVLYDFYSVKGPKTTVVEATNGPWKMEFKTGDKFTFTQDSRSLVFINPNDSLGIVNLEKDSVKYIASVSSFTLPERGDGRWLY